MLHKTSSSADRAPAYAHLFFDQCIQTERSASPGICRLCATACARRISFLSLFIMALFKILLVSNVELSDHSPACMSFFEHMQLAETMLMRGPRRQRRA